MMLRASGAVRRLGRANAAVSFACSQRITDRVIRRPLHDDPANEPLRNDVKNLGGILGNAIRKFAGEHTFESVEELRALARGWREGSDGDLKALATKIEALDADDLLAAAKAFTHFLSLANCAENHHRVRRLRDMALEAGEPLPSREDTSMGTMDILLADGFAKDDIYDYLRKQKVEIVLTAHPTEVNRRTLLSKHKAVGSALAGLDKKGSLTPFEASELQTALERTVDSIWNTDEVRRNKPTPQDEARAGIAVVEQVLWYAVPEFLRKLDAVSISRLGRPMPPDAAPVVFASWMGGDRDGNPNVTPEVTTEVSFAARWQAASLLLKDIRDLRAELSTTRCSPELRALAGSVREPYRHLLSDLEHKLEGTVEVTGAMLRGEAPFSREALLIEDKQEVMDLLLLLRRSLVESGQQCAADGALTDVIRRVAAFGLCLAPLDVRQESTLHTEALDAVTLRLGIGSYSQWDESARQAWLARELQGRRPLVPRHGEAGAFEGSVADTLRTFDAIAALGPDALGAYVISMAKRPSDVLAVKLLLKEAGCSWDMRVVPLFETLDDLEACDDTMTQLFALPWYRGHIGGRQEVMIGYSDSAKDAGRLAASWAQHRAQERLAKVAADSGVEITFFHGKGGTVSRGGNPALYKAILAQPAGTVHGRFRVTEQGEMITQNFGNMGIAERTLDIYTAGVLRDGFRPTAQKALPDAWRTTMDKLSEVSCAAYRHVVRGDPRFVPYFRSATPEPELSSLNIGSRPAKRRPGGGVETLRAIPWVFAWTQTRLNLPTWLGVGEGLSAVAKTDAAILADMYANWPFFNATVDLVEMVLSKSDVEIAARYDEALVDEVEALELGSELRDRLETTAAALLAVSGNASLVERNVLLRWQLALRNPYIDPLNLMQVSVLRRLRNNEFANDTERQRLEDALKITINGVAAGMRNTG